MNIDTTREAVSLLTNELLTRVPFRRFDETMIAVTPGNGHVEYYVPYSVQEERPLFIFDGDIPEHGLAKAAKEIHVECIGSIHQNDAHARKRRDFEIPIPLPTMLHRRFFIIPQGRGVLMRYRKRSLARQYIIVTAAHKCDTTWEFDTTTSTY